jgi:hypothetical protein
MKEDTIKIRSTAVENKLWRILHKKMKARGIMEIATTRRLSASSIVEIITCLAWIGGKRRTRQYAESKFGHRKENKANILRCGYRWDI